MEIRACVQFRSFFQFWLLLCIFPHTCSRAQVWLWTLHTFLQAHLSECFVLSLAQLIDFALALRPPLCVKFFYLLCAALACFTLADTCSMADPGSDNGRGLLMQPTPSDKLSVLWESLNLDFPEEVVSHSELNRTIRNFGFLATSFDQLDQWLESHGLLDFGSGTHADLRCLWHRSHALACSEGHTAAVPFPPQPSALPLPQDQSFSAASDPNHTMSGAASWNEPFPAKLSSDKTAELRAAFLRKYPSEVLDDSTMPSARLLALAFKQASSQEWRFIPWRWRMSVLELEEQQLQRPRKLARTELADLILDDVPSRNLPDTLGMFASSLPSSVLLRLALTIAVAFAHPTHWNVSRQIADFGRLCPNSVCKVGLWTTASMRTQPSAASWLLFWLRAFFCLRPCAARRAKEQVEERAMAPVLALATDADAAKARGMEEVVGVALAPVAGDPVWATKATPRGPPQIVKSGHPPQKLTEKSRPFVCAGVSAQDAKIRHAALNTFVP